MEDVTFQQHNEHELDHLLKEEDAPVGCHNSTCLSKMPPNLTYIGAKAFCKTALTHILFQSPRLVLGEDAFKDCVSLTTVILGSCFTDLLKFTVR